ncbi:MAG: AGE family epimerase/isomerase [Alphaproteobacteria bacterium]
MQSFGTQNWTAEDGAKFTTQKGHRIWLRAQADALLEFFEPQVINPAGGFRLLGNSGQPLPTDPNHAGSEQELHDTTRMVHCFSIGKLLGRSSADTYIDQGMDFIWNHHRDIGNGGYYWGVRDNGPSNPNKLAYGHAFVLLAASSAKAVGHRDADRLLEDVTEILHSRFWDAENGTTSEEYTADWEDISDYRGQNSNMHLTEALMAAYEVTLDQTYLDMAQSIAEFFINQHARTLGWRVPEHFDSEWRVDLDHTGDPVFRPKGVTPGHALEWSRLIIQLWNMNKRQHDWMPEAAKHLFLVAVETGWDTESGGLYYTTDWSNRPDQAVRLWWPCAEGVAAAAVLGTVHSDPEIEDWYRKIWGFIDNNFIDHKEGGWFPELDSELSRTNIIFAGKPDLYHALQACLIPLLPSDGSVIQGLIGEAA